jgi:hypothetical protein
MRKYQPRVAGIRFFSHLNFEEFTKSRYEVHETENGRYFSEYILKFNLP